MKDTPIQYADSSINPVMGCDGCELWTPFGRVMLKLEALLRSYPHAPAKSLVSAAARKVTNNLSTTSELYAARKRVAGDLSALLRLPHLAAEALEDIIRKECKCYAGHLGTMRAGHKGYADAFEHPTLFPGRLAAAANWGPPPDSDRKHKPWLLHNPRIIFISDMGDALSRAVPFAYLRNEIIESVQSPLGSRHIWLWLTKRPARMAQFGRWLAERGISWPENLVAMTSVTSNANAFRIDQLRRVPAKFKGISCEPMFSELNVDLTDIDWVIAGGGSDILAEPFHLEWALQLRDCCRESGTAFFLKQLGRNPTFQGQVLSLMDHHGGQWDEWPDPTWKIRQVPTQFQSFDKQPQTTQH